MTITPLFGNSRINILLIINITLVVYLSALVSGFSSLDDTGMMEVLQKGGFSFSSLVSGGGITYLRPLTILTYQVDYRLWGANPGAFHLTNLAIHTANACLIYYLCNRYLSKIEERKGASLFAALLFAVTPLNSEPVLWVSGRTDILCCFFFLAALIVLVSDRLTPILASFALFTTYLCSLLAKESSIALLGIVPVYLFFSENSKPLRVKIGLCSASAIATAIYLFMRLGPKGQVDTGTSKIISKVIIQPAPDLFYKSISAIGFYLKKLLWPYPLNLAIQNINEPLYFFAGLVAIIGLLLCFIRFSSIRLPLLIIVLSIVPPLLALHGNIPWTLYAERYLYIPMTGLAVLAGSLLANSRKTPRAMPFLLIIPLAVSTVYRSGLWADPVALWHDTTVKSPESPLVRVIYAYELIQAGRITEAEANIAIIREMKFENELLLKCIATINHERRKPCSNVRKGVIFK